MTGPADQRATTNTCTPLTLQNDLIWRVLDASLLTQDSRAERRPLCCQVVLSEFAEAVAGVRGRPGAVGRRLGCGPGVACPKSRRPGCEPAALETEPFPDCPPGPSAWVVAPRAA